MKVAIMQPYFFPYIGYFQLIAASDVFVLHDDVQYIKGGWVNRNKILLNGESRMITFPVQKDAYDLPINARNYVDDKQARKNIINLVKQAYAKAPRYRQVFTMLEELMMFEDTNVASFNENLIRRIAGYMGLRCKIITSSGMEKDVSLAGEQRVLDMCKRLGATDYTNPIGGTELYHQETFQKCGITLRFLEARNERYQQFGDTWVPFLSIIDVLMFNPEEEIRRLLAKFRLLSSTDIEVQH
ncbi:MAG TPA: WbqC family protein [Gallionella sp.]